MARSLVLMVSSFLRDAGSSQHGRNEKEAGTEKGQQSGKGGTQRVFSLCSTGDVSASGERTQSEQEEQEHDGHHNDPPFGGELLFHF